MRAPQVFIAAAREAKHEAAGVARALSIFGVETRCPWWLTVGETDQDLPPAEARRITLDHDAAIRTCDVFVLLTPGEGRGAQREAGMAIAHRLTHGIMPRIVVRGSVGLCLMDVIADRHPRTQAETVTAVLAELGIEPSTVAPVAIEEMVP
jgi:hypothetical protein